MERGFLKVGSWRGAPVRFHWTALVGALVFSRFTFAPAFWVAFLLLILIHELGHAQVVHWFRQTIVSVDVHGLGGWCRWRGEPGPIGRALIAWGGIFGQAALLVVTLVLTHVLGPPEGSFARQLHAVFVETNLWVMAINLLPFPPLDGAAAWSIVGLAYRRARRGFKVMRRRREVEHSTRQAERELRALDEIDVAPDEIADELLRRVTDEIRESRQGSGKKRGE